MTPTPTQAGFNTTAFTNAIQKLLSEGFLDAARQTEALAASKGHYIGSVSSELDLAKLLTIHPDMIAMKNKVRSIVPDDGSVLILGESGTGKELIAQSLHGNRGPVSTGGITIGRFVAINCPALSVDLMESELFGHTAGAYTGAIRDRVGKFQYAGRGTLFIDEIGDMPMTMQAAILRVLQEGRVTRVGANEDEPATFRLVCATNKDLPRMIEQGLFREDLYYRISTFKLHTTPLRKRRCDIPIIAQAYMDGLKTKRKLTDELHAALSIHPLPGNVRQLQQIIRRFAVLNEIDL